MVFLADMYGGRSSCCRADQRLIGRPSVEVLLPSRAPNDPTSGLSAPQVSTTGWRGRLDWCCVSSFNLPAK
jgi:hypothetical protein